MRGEGPSGRSTSGQPVDYGELTGQADAVQIEMLLHGATRLQGERTVRGGIGKNFGHPLGEGFVRKEIHQQTIDTMADHLRHRWGV